MDTNGGQWVTVAFAAETLSKSERTIRRWVADGKIPTDRTTPAILVDIAGHMPPADVPKPEGDTTTPDVAGEVAALQAEIERLREALETCQAERDRLWQSLDNAQAIALALTPKQNLLTEGERRRPWWRRVFDRER